MLEKTTVSATGLSWVDNVPGAVSTGYQAQNVAAESVRVGYDSIVIEAGESGGLTVKQGGTIDENGILYTVKSDQVIVTINGSALYYFALKNESNGNKSVEMISGPTFHDSVFIPAKNAFYTSDGRRILDTFVSANYYDFAQEVDYYSVFKLEKGNRSISKLPLSNNQYELIDCDSFSRFKQTCGGAQVYDFGGKLPINQINTLPNSGMSYDNEDGRVFVAGNGSCVYILAARSLYVFTINLTSHFIGLGIRGVAYIPAYTGFSTDLLAVATSDRHIRIFQNFAEILPSSIVMVKEIDLSGLADDLWGIDFKNGELYACTGTNVYKLYLLTSNILDQWDIPTKYFCIVGGSHYMLDPVNIVWSDQSSLSGSAFHISNYFYHRLTESYNSSLFRFRFGGFNCRNIAQGSGVFMSFDNLTGKLYVQ